MANLNARKARIVSPAAVLFLSLLVAGCDSSNSNIDPQLSQAMTSVRYMTSDRWISRSGFRQESPETRAQDYVNYVFSEFAAAEWPTAFDDFEAEQLRSAGITPLPPGVAIVPEAPDPASQRQVVIRAVANENKLVIEAYENPQSAPVSSFERAFK